ncbi:hypothetical protein GCK72_010439 [Caenorhabditis remanei]|uniref:Uncharacterized protein n=1 Tax=Caenorhabditis remanei TaxID=31234 RepID=A0A6A5H4S3_CAERE|nr:hypothetical protein GCK72_010439 [Caenorhabditis remanei]KAF1762177.1 hypothetical protein GCK72_010439 [Caenorhabditis remanei]
MSTISHAAITLEQSGFTTADRNGFQMYQLFPLHYRMHEHFVPDVGPVRIAKQMGVSNKVCYVSMMNGKYSQNNVIVFNVETNSDETEITTPSRYGAVTNIQVSHNRLAVFTATRLFVYQFPDNINQIRSEDIRPNPKGISAMSYDPTTSACYLAYPGFKTGSIQIMNLNTLTARESKSPVVIDAHVTEIVQVALNCQGTLVASGSTKGTVIRVYDARTKGMLYELRRGSVHAHLQCLAFSPCSSYLAVASDKGTLHVFGIRDAEPQKRMTVLERNLGSSSILKIQLDRQVLALGFSKQTAKSLTGLVAVCSDASYWRYHFSKDVNGKVHSSPPFYEELLEFSADASFFRTPLD